MGIKHSFSLFEQRLQPPPLSALASEVYKMVWEWYNSDLDYYAGLKLGSNDVGK